MIRANFFLGLLIFAGTAVAVITSTEGPEGREFSAEVVELSSSSGHALTGRIHAGKRQLRLESIDDGGTTVTIFDPDRKAMLVLDPQRRTYFKLPAGGYGGMTAFYAHSRDEPCGSGYRATRVGTEAVNGRMAEKWLCEIDKLPKYMENRSKEDLRLVFVIDPWHIWYDMEHSLMVRYVRYDGDGQELRDVRIEPQPEHLFAVPPDYRQVKSPLAAALDRY